MAKIKEYTHASGFDSGDVLLKDGTNGTKVITYTDAANAFFNQMVGAEMHRNFYRGKNLGSSKTIDTAHKNAITSGKFDDIFVGDYWTGSNNVNYRIADIDYYYNTGDTALTKHHVVVVPDQSMGSHSMNTTNDTTNGYEGSKMFTETLPKILKTVETDFPNGVLSIHQIFTNAVSSGHASGYEWKDAKIFLMNEINVYGTEIYSPMNHGANDITEYTIDKQQYALFRLNPKMVNRRYTYWLRDVVSATSFAYVNGGGGADYSDASASRGVRPAFVIGW